MKQLICLIFLMGSIPHFYAQNDLQLAQSTISKDIIKSHIYFLASDELKGRNTGSHGGNIAALYLANQLRKYGVQDVPGTDRPYMQSMAINNVSAAKSFKLSASDYASEKLLIIRGGNSSQEAEAVMIGYGLARDYEGVDVQGKWVIAKSGENENTNLQGAIGLTGTKRTLAEQLGALGLIEISDEGDRTWNSLSFYLNRDKTTLGETGDFVHVWLQKGEGELEKLMEEKPGTRVKIEIEGIETTSMKTQNVVGMVEGTDSILKDQFIIYSAHYDHVGVGKPDKNQDSVFNGARDNAVGSVTVLAMAENLARYPTKRSALFIFFTGEEKGLLGSQYYVEHPLLPLDKMVFCFNSDNGGYNDTSLATIIGLNRTTTAPLIVKAAKESGLKAIDDPAPEQNLFDRSDNVNFAKVGIPSPTYSLGFTAFDQEINRFYHQRTDQADNLDYEYLYKFFLSYVLSGRYIADDPNIPFWVEGDKYFEAGIELYDR